VFIKKGQSTSQLFSIFFQKTIHPEAIKKIILQRQAKASICLNPPPPTCAHRIALVNESAAAEAAGEILLQAGRSL